MEITCVLGITGESIGNHLRNHWESLWNPCESVGNHWGIIGKSTGNHYGITGESLGDNLMILCGGMEAFVSDIYSLLSSLASAKIQATGRMPEICDISLSS